MYIWDDEKEKIILPPNLHETALNELHDNPLAGHLGVTKTFDRMTQRFYWPNLRNIVADYVKSCRDCGMYKRSYTNSKPELVSIHSSRPFELIEIDVVGPFPTFSRGNKYILTIVCTYTKWPEAYAIPSQYTPIVLQCLEDLISRHGIPTIILSDQGRNFEAKLFKQFCDKYGIQKRRTTPYHPQCNGMVERFNGTLVKIIARFVSSNQKDRDDCIPAALHAYRSSVHSTTKYSPFFVKNGRESSMPIDKRLLTQDNVTADSYVKTMMDRLQTAYDHVRTIEEAAQKKYKLQHDKTSGKLSYQPQDRVWLQSLTKKKGLAPKLQPKYTGPYTILCKIGKVDYEISCESKNKVLVLHQSRLKPCSAPWQTQIKRRRRSITQHVVPETDSDSEQEINVEDESDSDDDE